MGQIYREEGTLMRKRIALALALLMLAALPMLRHTEAEETAPATVRVLLGTEGAAQVDVTVKGTYSVGDTEFTDGTLTASINNGTITVSHSGKGMLAASTNPVRVVRLEADKDEANLTLMNAGQNTLRTYLGDLIFYSDGGKLCVVNDVGIREYLYGVVSGEMSDSSPAEQLKVEAICAKCFALAEVAARTKEDFDVYDTTKSQLYHGYVAEDVNSIAAVDAVWENTLLYNGKVVKTYYTTANGGQIITPTIHWGGATDPVYSYGYDPFDLMGSSKNVTVTVNGADPSSLSDKLYAYFRSLAEAALGESVDTVESIVAMSGLYDPANPNGTSRYPKDLAPQTQISITMNVRTKAGEYRQATASFTPGELKSGGGVSASGTVSFVVRTEAQKWVLVFGESKGNRVGLSHRGAGVMARQGYSYVDILKFYYSGADLYDASGNVIPSTADFSFTYTGPEPDPTNRRPPRNRQKPRNPQKPRNRRPPRNRQNPRSPRHPRIPIRMQGMWTA